MLKGYKQEDNSLRESNQNSNMPQNGSSGKIITNILKKYLIRKEMASLKQIDSLPKIDPLLSNSQPCHLSGLQPRKRDRLRVMTEVEERTVRAKSVKTCDLSD